MSLLLDGFEIVFWRTGGGKCSRTRQFRRMMAGLVWGRRRLGCLAGYSERKSSARATSRVRPGRMAPVCCWRLRRSLAGTPALLMHELSIAMNIIEMVQEEAEKLGGRTVCAIHLKLGQFSGVVKEALLNSYELACEQTPLHGTQTRDRRSADRDSLRDVRRARAARALDATIFAAPNAARRPLKLLRGKKSKSRPWSCTHEFPTAPGGSAEKCSEAE